MNWRRGLFRLWIVGTALFVIAAVAIGYSYIKGDFDIIEPNKIFEVREPDGRIFEVQAPDMQSATAMVGKLPQGFVPDKPLVFDNASMRPNP